MYEGIIDLEKGLVFGEKGLNDGSRRNAHVICKEDCEFGVMWKDDYISVLKELTAAKTGKQRDFIQEKIFAYSISSQESERMSYDFFRLKFKAPKGAVIFKQGETVDFLYVVRKGKIGIFRSQKIEIKNFDHQLLKGTNSNESMKLASLGCGELFGDSWIVTEDITRFFTAVCLEDSTILKVPIGALRIYFDTGSQLYNILKSIVKKKLQNRLSNLKYQLKNREACIIQYNKERDPFRLIDEYSQRELIGEIEKIEGKHKNLKLDTQFRSFENQNRNQNFKRLRVSSPKNTSLSPARLEDFKFRSLTSRHSKVELFKNESDLAESTDKIIKFDPEDYVSSRFRDVCRATRQCKIDESKNKGVVSYPLYPSKKTLNRLRPASHSQQKSIKINPPSNSRLNSFFTKKSSLHKPSRGSFAGSCFESVASFKIKKKTPLSVKRLTEGRVISITTEFNRSNMPSSQRLNREYSGRTKSNLYCSIGM